MPTKIPARHFLAVSDPSRMDQNVEGVFTIAHSGFWTASFQSAKMEHTKIAELLKMADRVVTANLPLDLVERMEVIAGRLERSKSWIVKEAVTEWLAEEERRHRMTLEALASVDAGRTSTQEEVEASLAQRKRDRVGR